MHKVTQILFHQNSYPYLLPHFSASLSFLANLLQWSQAVPFSNTHFRVLRRSQEEKVCVSPDWDWKNFGKKKKKKKKSPHPHRRGDRPPETVNPRPLIDLKREAAFSDWHLFNTATLSRLLLRSPVSNTCFTLPTSIMFGMLQHHLHPGVLFFFFLWLCHLMEDQKVQGKLFLFPFLFLFSL